MKITCPKSELTNALSIVAKAIASKPQTPILAGIFMRAENGILELHATNNEIGMVCRIPPITALRKSSTSLPIRPALPCSA